MEVVGYAQIVSNPTTGVSVIPIKEFDTLFVRVIEFASDDSGILVVNNKATAIAIFDKCDVKASFKCTRLGEVICPPDLDLSQQMIYSAACMSREGGYNYILRNMVIMASLHKGEFNDNVLWQVNGRPAILDELKNIKL